MGALQSAPALSQQLQRPLATKVSPLFLASALIGWDHAFHPSVRASALVPPFCSRRLTFLNSTTKAKEPPSCDLGTLISSRIGCLPPCDQEACRRTRACARLFAYSIYRRCVLYAHWGSACYCTLHKPRAINNCTHLQSVQQDGHPAGGCAPLGHPGSSVAATPGARRAAPLTAGCVLACPAAGSPGRGSCGWDRQHALPAGCAATPPSAALLSEPGVAAGQQGARAGRSLLGAQGTCCCAAVTGAEQ